ncbi:MAG: hypothetical protein HYT71_01985 [Candidatus Aenigmarchaeota archaeon]|nr:hypothetical protein [Candidatus Aenigmarchaeota archaeon]
MYAEKTSLEGEKIISRYGALVLTNKRVVGEENIINLAMGGLGKLITKILGFASKTADGTVTEIKLDKIDSIKLALNRYSLLLKISNLLWLITLILLILIWVVAPYRSISETVIKIIGFILNLVTLGFLSGFFEPMLESTVSIISGSYNIPVMTFATSMIFFVAYMILKEIRLEIHSAKNMAFTNIIDFSIKGSLDEAHKFAKKVREAEDDHRKK